VQVTRIALKKGKPRLQIFHFVRNREGEHRVLLSFEGPLTVAEHGSNHKY